MSEPCPSPETGVNIMHFKSTRHLHEFMLYSGVPHFYHETYIYSEGREASQKLMELIVKMERKSQKLIEWKTQKLIEWKSETK